MRNYCPAGREEGRFFFFEKKKQKLLLLASGHELNQGDTDAGRNG
jgi:hypothetical protein